MLFHTLSAWLTLFRSIYPLLSIYWGSENIFVVYCFHRCYFLDNLFFSLLALSEDQRLSMFIFPYNFEQLFSFVLFQITTFRTMPYSAFFRCVLFFAFSSFLTLQQEHSSSTKSRGWALWVRVGNELKKNEFFFWLSFKDGSYQKLKAAIFL